MTDTKARVAPPIRMTVGVTLNPNIFIADFGPLSRVFVHEIKKMQCNLQKVGGWEGGGRGAKAGRKFSENSSVLVGVCIPIFKRPGVFICSVKACYPKSRFLHPSLT